MDMNAEEIANNANMHGKIKVTVQRGREVEKKSKHPRAVKLWEGYDAPDTKISSKDVVKDNRVSHAIKSVGINIVMNSADNCTGMW